MQFAEGVHWIKGENGSGKTTLFKSVVGLIPFEGEISLNGISLKKKPVDYRNLVNYAEAEPLYPGFLTAKDLIRFVGKTKGAGIDQQNFYSSAIGVDPFFEKPCETYSSGMLKKLSIALAFLGSPAVIVLDEPLITLDEDTKRILFGLIKDVLSKNTTVLISSHQLLENTMFAITASYRISNKTIQIE